MLTVYRPANFDNPRAAYFVGLSTDTKPSDQKNGATFEALDTGDVYRYDEENSIWYLGVAT